MTDQQTYELDGRFVLGNLIEGRPVGDIYQATDKMSGAAVNVLIVRPEALPSPEAVERARKEIVSSGSVNGCAKTVHFNVLPDGRLYTAYVPPEGTALSTRIAQGVIPWNEAVSYVESMASILRDASTYGVFHRELGPSNIYLNQDGTVTLMGFGVAQSIAQGIFGDPWFMSPEQANGMDPGVPGSIYSLTCMLYYMILGMPPYTDGDPASLIEKHKHATPPLPSSVRGDLGLPAAFDNFVLKGLSSTSNSRYPDFNFFINEMKNVFNPAVPEEKKEAVAIPGPEVNPPVEPPPQEVPQPAAAKEEPLKTVQDLPPVENEDDPGRRSPRRRRKGGFRETLWFKKGEENEEAAPVKADDLMNVKEGTGTISDSEKSLEEKYRDGQVDLSSEDRRKFSVRTGQTGVFQAVKVEDIKAAEARREEAESMAAEKRKKGKLVWGIIGVIILAGAIVGGIFGANKFLYKDIFAKDAVDNLENVLRKVKPAPPPQFIVSDKVDIKETSGKINELLKAKSGLIPEKTAGDGKSASELIMSIMAVNSPEAKKTASKLSGELFKTVFSLGYLDKYHDNKIFMERVIRTFNTLIPNDANTLNFKTMVDFYFSRKGKKAKISFRELLGFLPVYPAAPLWERNPETNLKKLYKMYLKLFKDDANLISDPKNSTLSVYMAMAEEYPKAKRVDRKLKKLWPEMGKKLKTKMLEDLKKRFDSKNWIQVRRMINAISVLDKNEKKAIEIYNKSYMHFPSLTLKEFFAKQYQTK
ncbi:MAG: hypothetical protein JXR95_00830 [Deltaproteobacteria bacterium]|nr:hypothetical protein [Deltaproteobacteria bacterium]